MRASDRAYRTLLDEIQSGALAPGRSWPKSSRLPGSE